MEQRILGRTGIHVSAVGMGCEGFEGKSEAASRELLDFAIKKGIHFLTCIHPTHQYAAMSAARFPNIRGVTLSFRGIWAQPGKTDSISEPERSMK